MSLRASAWARASLALLLLWLAGCAQPTRAPDPGAHWSGRLALQVQAGTALPETEAQSFHAGFELSGSAEQGQLLLSTPLGTSLARLRWGPGGAALEQGGQLRQAASLDALAQNLSGASLPIAALFDWLQGRATPAAGWQADLSGAAQGRITAQRWQPLPQATLRIIVTP